MIQNKVVSKGALRSFLYSLSVSILYDLFDIRETFEDEIIKEAMAPNSLSIVASMVAEDAAVMALIAQYAAKLVTYKANRSVEDPVLTSPCPPTSGFSLSSKET